MKIDDAFRLRLADELEGRVRRGELPEPLLGLLADSEQPTPAALAALAAAAAAAATEDSTDASVPDQVVAQTVVNAFGSPSLLIRDDSFDPPLSQTWKEVLEPRRAELERLIPAVGRIEVEHHPSHAWLGTGVLVAADVLATNRHVALQMAEEEAQGWRFAPGVGGQAIAASIDFREEHGVATDAEFALVDVLAVENSGGPDLAFLRVASHGSLPEPAPLGSVPAADAAVAAIGYTSREDGLLPEVEEILLEIFGTIYDVKRLAPGRVLDTSANVVSHDCSTQGGNSGSALVDVAAGRLSGIHFEGGLTSNRAVPAEVVRDRLDAIA